MDVFYDYKDEGFDTLGWWRERQEQFPILSGIARSVLGARPTSAAVERFFSGARALVTPLRTRLGSEKVELWMLNKNKQRSPKTPIALKTPIPPASPNHPAPSQ